MSTESNWNDVTNFTNGVIENPSDLKVSIFSEELGKSMTVLVPADKAINFMKNVPLYEAEVYES